MNVFQAGGHLLCVMFSLMFFCGLVYVTLSGAGICYVQRYIKSKLAAIIAFAVTYWVVKKME